MISTHHFLLNIRRLLTQMIASYLVFVAGLLIPGAMVHAADAPKPKPNLLIILADDLGFADLGCQDSPDVKTPHIDSIAVNGVRCTAGYFTAPQCSPSHAGLLSGRYQKHFGHKGNPKFTLMLMRGGKTIADHLKAAGYATAHFGKWHLGFESAEDAPKEIRESKDQMLPTQQGFDESFGYADYTKAAKSGGDMAPAAHSADGWPGCKRLESYRLVGKNHLGHAVRASRSSFGC